MTKSITFLLFAALCGCGSLFAQGSGSTGPSAGSGKSESPFNVTKVAKGKVLQAVSKGEMVVEVDGTRMSLRITESTEIKAEKGAKVQSPARVTVDDLKQGQMVRVKYRAADETALEVRILKVTS
jgi:hypothetical protein